MKCLRQLECNSKVDLVVGSRRYGEVGDAFNGVSENKVKDVM